jgi:ribosomal protein L37AE/L43A
MAKRRIVKTEYCPHCGRRTLFWDSAARLWRCRRCRYIYTASELSEYKRSRKLTKQRQIAKTGNRITFNAPLWLVNIFESSRFWKLLVCFAVMWWCWTAIQYSNNSIGLAVGLAIPILLLYAIKRILKRFLTGYGELASQHRLSHAFYSIRKSSLLRFAIIIVTIAILVTTLWSMVSLVYRFIQNASSVYAFNMLVLIVAQIWLLSWLCGMLKHSRQLSPKPKFAVAFWSLLAIAVFCAFVGIPPFSDVKNATTDAMASWWEQRTPTGQLPESPEQNPSPPPSSPTYSSTPYDVYKDEYPDLVWLNDYTYAASTSGRAIELNENHNAINPTWGQLLSFLKMDNTDKMTYVPDSFVCIDFAERLHNNAEKEGIRCGLVVLYPIQHACNVFETADKGLVFIDCTGLKSYEIGPTDEDMIVNVQLNADYCPKYLFADRYGNVTWRIDCLGAIARYQICWQAGKVMDYQYDYAIASIPSYVPSYAPSYIPPYVPPPSIPVYPAYVLPSTPPPKIPPSVPVCDSCCQDRCSKYQGIWRNGCIDDCMKGGTEKWTWK